MGRSGIAAVLPLKFAVRGVAVPDAVDFAVQIHSHARMQGRRINLADGPVNID
jgi:hypothetical protein